MKKTLILGMLLTLIFTAVGCSGGDGSKAEPIKQGDYTSEPGKSNDTKPANQ